MSTSRRSRAQGLLWLLGTSLLITVCSAKTRTLDLAAASSTEAYGPGHASDEYSSPNITISLPTSGSTGCISLKVPA